MPYELIYTSVPAGLKPGSSGFCTVAMTEGMPPTLIPVLEGMTTYKPLYPFGDPQFADNPAAFFHYHVDCAGKAYEVCGRICACAPDYSKRSNKIAHFIVFTGSESSGFPGGPAALPEKSFVTSWAQGPQWLPPRTSLTAMEMPARPAGTWQRIAGEAGWAGVLAQSFLDAPQKRQAILYAPEQSRDILELVREALWLLPAEERWKVNYSTCASAVSATARLQWCFCPKVPEQMSAAGVVPSQVLLDLTAPQPITTGGPLVEAARTGRKPSGGGVGEAVRPGREPKMAPPPSVSAQSPEKVKSVLPQPTTMQSHFNNYAEPGMPPLANSQPKYIPDMSVAVPTAQQGNRWTTVGLATAVSVLLLLQFFSLRHFSTMKKSFDTMKKSFEEKLNTADEKIKKLDDQLSKLSKEDEKLTKELQSLRANASETQALLDKARQEIQEMAQNNEDRSREWNDKFQEFQTKNPEIESSKSEERKRELINSGKNVQANQSLNSEPAPEALYLENGATETPESQGENSEPAPEAPYSGNGATESPESQGENSEPAPEAPYLENGAIETTGQTPNAGDERLIFLQSAWTLPDDMTQKSAASMVNKAMESLKSELFDLTKRVFGNDEDVNQLKKTSVQKNYYIAEDRSSEQISTTVKKFCEEIIKKHRYRFDSTKSQDRRIREKYQEKASYDGDLNKFDELCKHFNSNFEKLKQNWDTMKKE